MLVLPLAKLGKPGLSMKQEQEEVFMWLLTGFGKSICFQALPIVFDYKLELVSAESCGLDGGPRANGVSALIVCREGKLSQGLLASPGKCKEIFVLQL